MCNSNVIVVLEFISRDIYVLFAIRFSSKFQNSVFYQHMRPKSGLKFPRPLLVYISGERLQDHWSSGLCIPSVWCVSLNSINSSDSEFLASNQIVTRFRLCP